MSSTQITIACGCFPYSTVLEDFEEADLVVIARLVSLEKATKPTARYGGDIKSATMLVEKVFKGGVKVNEVLAFGQGDEVLDCSWTFHKTMIGEQYLLYLDAPERPSESFYISTCNRSRKLEYARDDLLYLNNMDKLRGRTRISGVLSIDSAEDVGLEGWKIRVIGRRKTYVATTDKNGVYELYDLPLGRYLLEPEMKFGWKVDEFHLTRQPIRLQLTRRPAPSNRVAFTLRPRRHFGVDLRLKLSNHISGAVYDSSSKPLQGVCVSLAPANDERSLGCNSLTDERGRFLINSVSAGTYLLIFNYKNERTPRMPFSKLYYPGVPQREKAKPIAVRRGENVNNLSVVIGAEDH